VAGGSDASRATELPGTATTAKVWEREMEPRAQAVSVYIDGQPRRRAQLLLLSVVSLPVRAFSAPVHLPYIYPVHPDIQTSSTSRHPVHPDIQYIQTPVPAYYVTHPACRPPLCRLLCSAPAPHEALRIPSDDCDVRAKLPDSPPCSLLGTSASDASRHILADRLLASTSRTSPAARCSLLAARLTCFLSDCEPLQCPRSQPRAPPLQAHCPLHTAPLSTTPNRGHPTLGLPAIYRPPPPLHPHTRQSAHSRTRPSSFAQPFQANCAAAHRQRRFPCRPSLTHARRVKETNLCHRVAAHPSLDKQPCRSPSSPPVLQSFTPSLTGRCMSQSDCTFISTNVSQPPPAPARLPPVVLSAPRRQPGPQRMSQTDVALPCHCFAALAACATDSIAPGRTHGCCVDCPSVRHTHATKLQTAQHFALGTAR
jgi:hypothetical protein